MTTIVYRDGVLAGDRLLSVGTVRDSYLRKVHKRRRDGALVGGAGTSSQLQTAFNWFLSGEEGPRPSLGPCELIIVRPDGVVEYHDRHGSHRMDGWFFAIGSGAEVAYGAMEMGATARQAVEIAARRDANTSPEMNWVKLR